MKFELKNIKHAEFASEETNCYNAALYVDGVRIAEVSNDGHGGCDFVHPYGKGSEGRAANQKVIDAAEAWLKDQPKIVTDLPSHNDEDEFFTYSQSLETVCGDLLQKWLVERDVKKALKRRIMFTKPNEDGIYELPARFKPTKENIAQYHEQKPEYRILNNLDLDEVVVIWKEQA